MNSAMRKHMIALSVYLLAVQIFLSPPLHAAPVSVELCEAPLLLHLRPPTAEFEQLAPESFELCEESALTEFLPMPDAEETLQTQLAASGMKLQLTRTKGGMRVQLRLGQYHAQEIVLASNAPERALRWEPPAVDQPEPSQVVPKLLARVEQRPPGTGLSQHFKVYALNQPADEIAKKLIARARIAATGFELLCKEKITLNFEAMALGQLLALISDSCALAMRTPANGAAWHFVRPKVNPDKATPPAFADYEAELKHRVLLAKQDWMGIYAHDAEEPLFELAELARLQQKYAEARGYLAQIRALPESWFASSATQIDIALARIATQAGQHTVAHEPTVYSFAKANKLLDKILRTLDRNDPDQISAERADSLEIRAQLFAAQGKYAAAASTAQSALRILEQAFGECEDAACEERTQTLLKTLANAQLADQQWAGAEQSLRRVFWRLSWDSPARLWAVEALANSLQRQAKSDREVWLNVFEDAQQHFSDSVAGENVDAFLQGQLRAARELAASSLNALNPDTALFWWNRVRSLRLQMLGENHARTRAATLEIAVLVQLLQYEGVSAQFEVPEQSFSERTLASGDAFPAGLSKHIAELQRNLLSDAIAKLAEASATTSVTAAPRQRATVAAWLAEFRLAADGKKALAQAVQLYSEACDLQMSISRTDPRTMHAVARRDALKALLEVKENTAR